MNTAAAQTENATLQQAAAVDVHQIEYTSSTSLTSSHQNSSQLLDQVGSTQSQQEVADHQVNPSQQASSESLNTQKETRQAADKNFWHVSMECDAQAASNQATMESAIARLTSQSSSQQQVTVEETIVQPTSVMVEVSTVQEQQLPKVITVDIPQERPQPPSSSSSSSSTVLQKQDSAQFTVSVTKQQQSFNSQVMSHQVTMEKAMTQSSTDTKGSTSTTVTTSLAATAPSAAPTTVMPTGKQSTESIDESDGSPQAADNQQDFDFSDMKFNDILNDLLELSGEADTVKKSSVAGRQSTDKTSAEYHTLSLFSDVPISAPPPPKSELVSKQKKESSQITITVKKEDKQQKTNNKSVVSNKMQSASTTNKSSAAEVSNIKKESPPAVVTKESVTTAMSKQSSAGKQSVPVAISHKKEMQQQKDGTDNEWSIDLGDIDNDLASQLEELNSIIGQLGGIVI